MIKKLTTAVLIGLAIFNVQGQTLNLKGGINLATINQNYEDPSFEVNPESRIGFHVGLYLPFEVLDRIEINPGVGYTEKGYVVTDNSDSFEAVLQYIQLPIDLNYYVSEALFLSFGTYIAYGTGGYLEYRSRTPGFGAPPSEKLVSFIGEVEAVDLDRLEADEFPINGLDLGISMGLGYQFERTILSLQYAPGLSDINANFSDDLDVLIEADLGVDPENLKDHNSVFSLSLAIKLGSI